MENQASTPQGQQAQGQQAQGQQAQGLQAQGQQGQQGLFHIQIPTEREIQEYNREKEDRRQRALERLRNENRSLPQEQQEETPPPFVCPSVPRFTTDSVGWESVIEPKKN
jgi:hypothetical protein